MKEPMKKYQIALGICGPTIMYSNMIKAHNEEEAVNKYITEKNISVDEEKRQYLIEHTYERITEKLVTVADEDISNLPTNVVDSMIEFPITEKPIIPDEVVILDEGDYFNDCSWKFIANTKSGEKTYVIAHGSISNGYEYLANLVKEGKIESFTEPGDLRISVDHKPIYVRQDVVDFKTNKPKGQYCYIVYAVDLAKKVYRYKAFYDETIDCARATAKNILKEAGYKFATIKALRYGSRVNTGRIEGLTDYYTAYDVEIGCERI